MNNDTEKDELGQLLIKLTYIAQQLDKRSEQAVQRVEASGAMLDHSAQRLNGGSEQFAREALRVIAAEAQQVIASGVGQAANQLSSGLSEGARAAQQAAQGLQGQRALLSRAQTALVWKSMAALIIGSLLAVGSSGYFVWKSMRQIEQANFGQDILRATQNGTLNHCGGALCAKVGKRLQRYGDNSDYVLVQP
jgi:hypothetical protein